eukprot:756064-Hanusia_phi.AAC.7
MHKVEGGQDRRRQEQKRRTGEGDGSNAELLNLNLAACNEMSWLAFLLVFILVTSLCDGFYSPAPLHRRCYDKDNRFPLCVQVVRGERSSEVSLSHADVLMPEISPSCS